MVIVLMGVAGAGKSTVGAALAERLGFEFLDADDLHPAANVTKMKAGIPLNDADRAPWLDAVAKAILLFNESYQGAVVACSLLKERYRDRLAGLGVSLVYLRIDRETASARSLSRHHHYMHASLVASQYVDLEEPRDALVVDAARSVEEIVRQIISKFGLKAQGRNSPITDRRN